MQVSNDFQNDKERIVREKFGNYMIASTEIAYSAYPQAQYLNTSSG
jgi:hypothetical protein